MQTAVVGPALPRVRGAAVAAVASAALATALGASLWLVLAAAERPSLLSPPTLRAPHRWLLGPPSGALPHLTTSRVALEADLTIALVVLCVAWLAAWATAPALPVRAVAAAVGLTQAVWVLGPPQPITDVFNYVAYGRMAVHGLNPYTHIPAQGPHDGLYALSNWHHLPSPYGPLFTLLCEPIALLPTPVAYWVVKVLVVAAALGVLALVWWLAVRLGRSPQRALACVGLCPVVLAVGVGGFHNDTLPVLCVIAAAACLVRRWDAGAGALAVAAAALKPSFAVAVPIVILGAHHRPAALAGAAGAGGAAAALVLVAFGGALPAIAQQGRLVTPLSAPNLLGL